MRGRKPKPTHLKEVAGNPGKRPLNRNEPQPVGELFEPPGDLPEKARPFWTQAIADAPPGLLRRLDLRVMTVWAVAAWQHAEAAGLVAAEGALITVGKSKARLQHPAMAIMNRQAQIMLRAAAEMGFTPSARSRVSAAPRGAASRDDDDFSEFA